MSKNAQLECFTHAYITCALWSSTDGEGTPLDDGRDADDLAPETLVKMQADCAIFYARHEGAIQCDGAPMSREDLTASESERKAAMAGHDFWLNRNGHGAGFWDGDWPEPHATALDKGCAVFRPCDPYVGDDGLIYLA